MNRPALLSLTDALPQLLSHAHRLSGVDVVSTFDADDRVLAQDVVSASQVPPQDNSSMDGYALRFADCAKADAVLKVTQRIPAGSHGTTLHAGEVFSRFGPMDPPLRRRCDARCQGITKGRSAHARIPRNGC